MDINDLLRWVVSADLDPPLPVLPAVDYHTPLEMVLVPREGKWELYICTGAQYWRNQRGPVQQIKNQDAVKVLLTCLDAYFCELSPNATGTVLNWYADAPDQRAFAIECHRGRPTVHLLSTVGTEFVDRYLTECRSWVDVEETYLVKDTNPRAAAGMLFDSKIGTVGTDYCATAYGTEATITATLATKPESYGYTVAARHLIESCRRWEPSIPSYGDDELDGAEIDIDAALREVTLRIYSANNQLGQEHVFTLTWDDLHDLFDHLLKVYKTSHPRFEPIEWATNARHTFRSRFGHPSYTLNIN